MYGGVEKFSSWWGQTRLLQNRVTVAVAWVATKTNRDTTSKLMKQPKQTTSTHARRSNIKNNSPADGDQAVRVAQAAVGHDGDKDALCRY